MSLIRRLQGKPDVYISAAESDHVCHFNPMSLLLPIRYLIDEGVGPADAVRPRDAHSLIRTEGYTLVDLRIQWSHDEWHLEDAHHVPMLRVIEGNGAAKIWRKFGSVPPLPAFHAIEFALLSMGAWHYSLHVGMSCSPALLHQQ